MLVKAKSRKKAYTPECENAFSNELYKFLGKVLKKSPDKIDKFLQEAFSKKPEFEVIYLAIYHAPQAVNFLIEMGDKGADLNLLFEVVYHAGTFTKHNESVEEVNKRARDYIKKEKAIKGAVKLLCNLKPLPNFCLDVSLQNFNRDLETMQGQIKTLTATYLEFMPFLNATPEDGKRASLFLKERNLSPRSLIKGKAKPIKQNSSLWNEVIILLVDEFKRIGFSNKQAYKKTAEFLNIAFSHVYIDKDPDLVRQRYSYHSKKNPQE